MVPIFKILRKIGLGRIAYDVLCVFGTEKVSMSADKAYELLNSFCPDIGGSSIMNSPLVDTSEDIDLDIIIPCYNAEKYVRECIESVINQRTRYSWRIIAVDDGSTDATPE